MLYSENGSPLEFEKVLHPREWPKWITNGNSKRLYSENGPPLEFAKVLHPLMLLEFEKVLYQLVLSFPFTSLSPAFSVDMLVKAQMNRSSRMLVKVQMNRSSRA